MNVYKNRNYIRTICEIYVTGIYKWVEYFTYTNFIKKKDLIVFLFASNKLLRIWITFGQVPGKDIEQLLP